VAGNIAGLPALLQAVEPSFKITAAGEPDANGFVQLALTTEREDEFGEPLLQALIAHSYRVRALSRAHPTLEDVFLAATRRTWDAAQPNLPKPPTSGPMP
jgi:ABC-2 type transport system ATP-binding protein